MALKNSAYIRALAYLLVLSVSRHVCVTSCLCHVMSVSRHVWTVCCSHLTILYGATDEEDASKEVDACLSLLFQWAASCDKKQFVAGDASPSNGVLVDVRREPLGVIGIVQTPVQSPPGPWALLGFISLFAPAVCCGNSVVVTADSMHPTAALEFCEVRFLLNFILLGKDST